MRKDLVVRAFSPGYSFLYLARETFHRPRQVGARKDTYTHTRLPRCALTSPPTLTLSPTPPPAPPCGASHARGSTGLTLLGRGMREVGRGLACT